jgi:hypothetical protein
MRTQRIITIVLFALILILILLHLRKPKSSPVEILKIDTITLVKPVEKVVIRRAKPKIIFRRDTIIQTHPFVVSIDTAVQRDTISLQYRYPENILDLSISSVPDTFKVPKIVYSFDKKKERWWEKPAIFVLGTAFGYLLCKIK